LSVLHPSPLTSRRQARQPSTHGDRDHRIQGAPMFIGLFLVLLVAWVMGWTVFHVAGGLIHLLLVIALISLVLHFVRGGRATV